MHHRCNMSMNSSKRVTYAYMMSYTEKLKQHPRPLKRPIHSFLSDVLVWLWSVLCIRLMCIFFQIFISIPLKNDNIIDSLTPIIILITLAFPATVRKLFVAKKKSKITTIFLNSLSHKTQNNTWVSKRVSDDYVSTQEGEDESDCRNHVEYNVSICCWYQPYRGEKKILE